MYHHGSHLRKGRHSEDNRTYLITTVTHGRLPIFGHFELARLLIDELRTTSSELAIETQAWVVMPDHLHWMFVLNQLSVSDVVRCVKGRSSYAINRYCDYHGPVWQKGFHDHAIRNEEDIKCVARYIIANPLRAGLVDKIGNYPFWDAVWL